MKMLGYLFAGIALSYPIAGQSANTAQATIFCYSLQFQRGLVPDGSYFLDLTSVPGSVNGELALDFFNSGYSHSSYLALTDETLGETLSGALALEVPDGGDSNKDGFQDFFQVSQGVTNQVSSGAYSLEFFGNGKAIATWNRPAGSKDGWCALNIELSPFRPVTFSLSFEILEYKGTMSYSPGGTNVTGTVDLEQTGRSGSRLSGPVRLVKSPGKPFDELVLNPGAWTNQMPQVMSYTNHLFTRDARWPTSYFGFLEFDDDADLGTWCPYSLWMLSIDDANDSDNDGIPDLSDDPTLGPSARQPRLDLARIDTNLVLTLRGDVGYSHEIQSLSDLLSTNWQRFLLVTLTNDPQSVTIGIPPEASCFWRVKTK